MLVKGPQDVAFSFLPLSHAFERTVSYCYLDDGVVVTFAESIDSVSRDLPRVQPTLMTGVPRVFEKLHARIMEAAGAAPAPRRWIFTWALGVGLLRVQREQKNGGRTVETNWQDRLADKLVFSKIRERVGGRLRVIVSGSAPLPVHVAEFFGAVGLPIMEGYGLTETSPVLTVNPRDAIRNGTVGVALPGIELRIADDGEILARGPNLMKGYWKKPEATAEVIDADGWFHTGDIGQLTDGYLSITDRKKDLIVTSGGKKLAPQPIEIRLKQNPLVAEAIVIGDRRRYPAVVFVPDFKVLEKRLAALGRPLASREDLVSRADVLGLYQEVVDALNRDLAAIRTAQAHRAHPGRIQRDGRRAHAIPEGPPCGRRAALGFGDRADVRAHRKGELIRLAFVSPCQRLRVARYSKILAVGRGHHRNWTLPMMYFFGTSPQ